MQWAACAAVLCIMLPLAPADAFVPIAAVRHRPAGRGAIVELQAVRFPKVGRPVVQPGQPSGRGSIGAFGVAAFSLLSAAAFCRRPLPRHSGRVIVRGRKWENIKRGKATKSVADAKRIGRHLKTITIAVRDGGADEDGNAKLQRAIKAALKDNVTRSSIDGAIKKFTSGAETLVEMTFQGYSAGGAAVWVEMAGPNEAAMRSEINVVFGKCGGQVGASGCVTHLFNKEGVLRFEDKTEEELMEASLEAEAEVEDCRTAEDGIVEAVTTPQNFHAAITAFEGHGLEPSSSAVEVIPVEGLESNLSEGNAYETLRLLHLLDNLDDVQDVHTNAVIPDDVELQFKPQGDPQSWAWVEKMGKK